MIYVGFSAGDRWRISCGCDYEFDGLSRSLVRVVTCCGAEPGKDHWLEAATSIGNGIITPDALRRAGWYKVSTFLEPERHIDLAEGQHWRAPCGCVLCWGDTEWFDFTVGGAELQKCNTDWHNTRCHAFSQWKTFNPSLRNAADLIRAGWRLMTPLGRVVSGPDAKGRYDVAVGGLGTERDVMTWLAANPTPPYHDDSIPRDPPPPRPKTTVEQVHELYAMAPRWARDGQGRRRGERWESFQRACARCVEPRQPGNAMTFVISRDGLRATIRSMVAAECGDAPGYGA